MEFQSTGGFGAPRVLSREVLIQFQSGRDQNTLSESLIQHIFRPYLRGSGLTWGQKPDKSPGQG